MKKLFVSVPMKGRTEEEIKASVAKMKNIAEAYEGEELELIDSLVEENPPADCNVSVWYLGKAIEKLAMADIFIGIRETTGWAGCQIEADTAQAYNIKRYFVDTDIIVDYKVMVARAFQNATYNTNDDLRSAQTR
jgi:hypothetical protein